MSDLHIDFDVKCENKVNKDFTVKLVSAMREALNKVTDSINTMSTDFSKRFDELEANYKSMRTDITAVAQKAETALDIANQNRTELEQLRIENVELKQWCRKIQNEAAAVKSQTNSIETYSRRDNVIFYGIKEPQNETPALCEKAVKKFFVDHLGFSDVEAGNVVFVRCHRINNFKHKSNNPIIVRFKDYKDREHVWSKKTAISDKTLNMGEDFPKDIAYNRRKLFPVFSKARKIMDKKLVSLKADNLMINGKRYTVNSLNELSGELNMRTFSERSNDKVVVFGGFYSNFHPLSNFYKASMTFRNHKYHTLEQAYQHTKALLFKDGDTAADILATDSPAEAKRLSYNIKGFKMDVWNTKRHDLMVQLVQAKFQQHPILADELRSTGKKTISESGKHKYFANGLSITHRDILNMKQWTAQSKLGDILMTVRRELPPKEAA